MADTPATTTEGSDDHPSEFAHPVGVGDSAVFDKFFGKESKHFEAEKKPKGEGKDGKSWQEKDEKKEPAKAKDDGGAKTKTPSDSSEKKSKESKPAAKTPTSDEKKPSASSKTASSKDEESAEQTSTSETPDPKKLFKEAKAETDRRKSRGLMKKAMEAAFGEVPEEFSDARWAAGRKKREEEDAAISKKRQQVDGQLQQGVQKLTPAINVMKRLQAAGFVHVENGQVTSMLKTEKVDQAIEVMKALRELEEGDYTSLGRIVEKASGKPADEAMKLFVRGVKASPEGRAARTAAEQAQQQARAAQARVAELERKLQERETTQSVAQQKQAKEAEQQKLRGEYVAAIGEELDGHPVLKLPKGAERVLRYLIRTRHPTLKSPTVTYQQAADRIWAAEEKRAEVVRGALPEDATPAGATRARVAALSRTETVDNGVQNPSPEAAFDRIWSKHSGARR